MCSIRDTRLGDHALLKHIPEAGTLCPLDFSGYTSLHPTEFWSGVTSPKMPSLRLPG